MVRYSDIIKSGIKKKEEDLTKDTPGSEKPEKADNSLRLSTLKEFSTSSGLNSLPAQKDAVYMKELHSTIVDYLKDVRKLIKNDEHFDIKQAIDIINHIINTPDLIENFYQAIALNNHNNEESYLILHLINVMVYALKIGTGMKYSREELLELGLAALFYDVGLLKIPESITEKKERLTETELELIKKHTEIGENILSHFQAEHPMMPQVACEHHERRSGDGYPKGLKGKEICEYAKIIGLLDTFDAMIHNRPHRKALAQHFSVKELVESKNVMFSPRTIKVFLDKMGIFPIGSYVRLNNMEIGKVVAISNTQPLRPTVKVIFNDRGERVSDETLINLEGHPVLYITDAVSEEDFPSDQVV
ncbi:MAG: hypothetical protein SRB1_02467 [Desulfobacteraceae bacterium Eth-SRB1]|nr:MAG: hypothetical protein SRB1_02467 [Desulfobacteraceae bacterium Eth-SRB1]